MKDVQVYALKKLIIIKEMAIEKNKMEEEVKEKKEEGKPCGKLVKVILLSFIICNWKNLADQNVRRGGRRC